MVYMAYMQFNPATNHADCEELGFSIPIYDFVFIIGIMSKYKVSWDKLGNYMDVYYLYMNMPYVDYWIKFDEFVKNDNIRET